MFCGKSVAVFLDRGVRLRAATYNLYKPFNNLHSFPLCSLSIASLTECKQ